MEIRFLGLFILVLLIIIGAGYILVTNALPESFVLGGGLHNIDLLLGLIAIFLALRIRKEFGKILGDAMVYIIFGLVFITAIQAFLFFFISPVRLIDLSILQLATISHMLSYAGILSFIYAFYMLLRRIRTKK